MRLHNGDEYSLQYLSLAHSRGIAGCKYMTNAWILCSLQIVLYIDTYQLVDIYVGSMLLLLVLLYIVLFSVYGYRWRF